MNIILLNLTKYFDVYRVQYTKDIFSNLYFTHKVLTINKILQRNVSIKTCFDKSLFINSYKCLLENKIRVVQYL